MNAVWEKYLVWPTCAECRSTGVAVDPKTSWPTECLRCKAGREAAVKKAKAARSRAVRKGET